MVDVDRCPQCGSDLKDEPEIACIRAPEEHEWHREPEEEKP